MQQSVEKCITRRNWEGGRGRCSNRIKKRNRKQEQGKRSEEWRNIEIQIKGVNLIKDAGVYKESSGIEEGGRSWMNIRI